MALKNDNIAASEGESRPLFVRRDQYITMHFVCHIFVEDELEKPKLMPCRLT
jgi:hypothetical protein